MSKRPTDADEPPAKKRGSSRQLTKDDASDEESEERGSIQTAPAEVMKARRVVKARRGTGAPPPTPTGGVPAAGASSNPFASVNLSSGLGTSTAGGNGFASLAAAKLQADTSKTAAAGQEKKEDAAAPADASQPAGGEGSTERSSEAAAPPVASAAPAFATFASTAAPFAATAGSGQAFNFGSAINNGEKDSSVANGEGKDDDKQQPGPFSFAATAAATGSGFSFKPAGGSFPAVQSIFGGSSAPAANGASEGVEAEPDNIKPALASLPPETETVTGEEDEETLWSGEGTLYEFDAQRQWRERGKGELRINRGQGRPARFVMRQRGYLRLLMNANLWPEMRVTPMDGGKGATFPVVNAVSAPDAQESEGSSPKLQTFAFRLKAAGQLDAFISAINEHKVTPDPAAAAAARDATA